MFYDHELEFKDFDSLARELEKYIDYYNNVRIKHSLGGLSPVKYREKIMSMIK